MHINDISRQQFSKIATRGLRGRMTLTGEGSLSAPEPCWPNWTTKPLHSKRNKSVF
jgi:hypothetical protein